MVRGRSRNTSSGEGFSFETGRGGGRDGGSYDDFRIENHNVYRVPPRERDFMHYDMVSSYWGRDPHYFGWRIDVLPPHYRRVRYYGIDYFFYNDVFYRPFGGHYIVCRPPVGVIIDRAIRDIVFSTVNFAFYTSVYHAYDGYYEANSRTIDEQNRIIARNNATIAAQNRAIAMNSSAASSSYEVANALGLVQSYAYADRDYYYEDGVFYILNSKGRYEVIVPPAGALVESLPDDYETITLGGTDYYRVDNTVYRTVLVDGVPYVEVLGQMYGDLAQRYNIY